IDTAILIAREDFVAGIARDIEFAAQHRHLLPLEQPSHKSHTFIHLGTRLPRHLRSPPNANAAKCQKVLPMCPECRVTHVPERAQRVAAASVTEVLPLLPFCYHLQR